MEVTENAEQGSVPLNSREDQHWVEKLFPPRFTLENLLENLNTSGKHLAGMGEPQRGHRRQIYLTALKEVQHIDTVQKREALAKRIIRRERCVNRMCNEEATAENLTVQSPRYSRGMDDKDTCIWNENDIGELRAGFAEMARDRCRLMHKLGSAEQQLKAELEEKRKLKGLVQDLEERLSLSIKNTARQSLVINDMKTRGQKTNVQLRELAIQVREKEEELNRWKTKLRNAKEDLRKNEQERFDLARELDRVQAQQRTERDRLEKVVQIENEAALLKLQRELERARTELSAERDSHARSHAALDLLRKHFSSQ